MQGIKKTNEYVRGMPAYAQTPKAVYAALAYSLALRLTGEEDHEGAMAILTDEWRDLTEQGIIPQKPVDQ